MQLSGFLSPTPLSGVEIRRAGGHCGMKKTTIEHSQPLNRHMLPCLVGKSNMSRNKLLTTHWPGTELWEKMNMDDIEEVLEALRVVYANLERLHLIEGPEFLLPDRVD